MTLMLMINEYYVLLNIKSTIKYSTNGCTGQAVNPQYIAKNLLNREFTTDALNEKRLTDSYKSFNSVFYTQSDSFFACSSNSSKNLS